MTTFSIVSASLADAKAQALDRLDQFLEGQWHEIMVSRTHDGKFRVTVKVRND